MVNKLPTQKIEALKTELSSIKESFVENHLTRLDIDYFNQYSREEIENHLKLIQNLSSEKLCQISLEKKGPHYLLTAVGFDLPGFFTILSGLLTVHGFDIRSGSSFTYGPYELKKKIPSGQGKRALEEAKREQFYLEKSKVIDFFELTPIYSETLPEHFEENFLNEFTEYLKLVQAKKQDDVRTDLNQKVSNYLTKLQGKPPVKMLPIDITVDSDSIYTILKIKGSDTPAFLYSLSNALNLRGMKIHKVFIETDIQKVKDTIYITNKFDKTISEKAEIEKLNAIVVLVKQFTLLLPYAPNPDLAMRQFYQFLEGVVSDEKFEFNILDMENPLVLSSLAKIFGTGEFLWEEFVRMQHKSLLPFVKDIDKFNIKKDRETLEAEFLKDIQKEESFDSKIRTLNQLKDKELFRLDLLQMIFPGKTFIEFSEELDTLAQATFSIAGNLIYENLKEKFGTPQLKGKECAFGLFALGKFGGGELGYASDIELVLIFDDSGTTKGGKQSVSNEEFFNNFVTELKDCIRAKEAGIFEIDLRLRPFGNKGQMSCTLQLWEEYYGAKGNAYDFERQALIKLRPIFGNQKFTKRVIQARDQILYSKEPLSFENTFEMRKKQLNNLIAPGKKNAKFSEGGLVDLEYSVQFLQLLDGKKHEKVRAPNTIQALERLLEIEALSPTEFEKLFNCYAFERRLINALRMVRGNAKDLVIPDKGSREFLFLTRRLGYVKQGQKSPREQLEEDMDRNFKTVKDFFRIRFVDGEKRAFPESSLLKLIEKDELTPTELDESIGSFRFQDKTRAFKNLKEMFQGIENKRLLLTVLVLAERYIAVSPDADQVLLRFQNYLNAVKNPSSFLTKITFNPRLLEIIVLIFGYSEYLSNILINDPELILYLAKEDTLFINKSRDYFTKELEPIVKKGKTLKNRMDHVRGFWNREMLRLGLRDIYSGVPFERTVREISNLTDVVVDVVYQEIIKENNFDVKAFSKNQSIIALGKLGGRELNYSSDIDIVFVYPDKLSAKITRDDLEKVNSSLMMHLTDYSPLGKLLRVDLRLRPYGKFGTMTGSYQYHIDYYQEKADGWELQAWLKARPVAGDIKLGESLVAEVQKILVAPENKKKVFKSIADVRSSMLKKLEQEELLNLEVKLGAGGIRAIEFMIQNYQVRLGDSYPDIISGNSLFALSKLKDHEIITSDFYEELKEAYIFLRNIEHRIQLLGLQQLHVLPQETNEVNKLAKRLQYEDHFQESAGEQFLKDYERTISQIEKYAKKVSKETSG